MDLSTITVTDFYSINVVYNRTGATKTRKNREFWALILKFEGETEYFSGEKHLVSNLCNPVLLPKGSNYTWTCKKGGYFYTVEFDCDQTDLSIYSKPVENPEKLLKSLRSLEAEKEKSPAHLRLKGMRFVYEILYELFLKEEGVYTQSYKQKIIAPAVEYLTSHPEKPADNITLANLSGVSVSYFRRVFKEVYGVSPIQYATTLRIEKAKELLKSDFSKIGDVAALTGYKNIYHFSKAFKHLVGVSPLEFSKTPYKN